MSAEAPRCNDCRYLRRCELAAGHAGPHRAGPLAPGGEGRTWYSGGELDDELSAKWGRWSRPTAGTQDGAP